MGEAHGRGSSRWPVAQHSCCCSRERAPAPQATPGGAHEASAYYRRQAKPPARKGGYSYNPQDTINTYGDARTKYGSTNFYRFWGTDKQTISGPFDSGFFFDSAIAPRGGDAPYLN